MDNIINNMEFSFTSISDKGDVRYDSQYRLSTINSLGRHQLTLSCTMKIDLILWLKVHIFLNTLTTTFFHYLDIRIY